MFSVKKPPPHSESEPNGIEIKVRLSEAAFVKLIPLFIALLLGSGIWVRTQSLPASADSVSPVGTPQER